jgi:group I intron endonuclease
MKGIYKIINPEGQIYIGKSSNIEKRWNQYKNFEHKNQPLLFNSFRKYGWYNHIFELVEECSGSKLSEKEKHWIDFYNSIQEGLNCNPNEYLIGKAGPKKGTTKGISKITPEGKKIKSTKMKNLWESGEMQGRGKKPVINNSTQEIFSSLSEAVKQNKLSFKQIYIKIEKGDFSYV